MCVWVWVCVCVCVCVCMLCIFYLDSFNFGQRNCVYTEYLHLLNIIFTQQLDCLHKLHIYSAPWWTFYAKIVWSLEKDTYVATLRTTSIKHKNTFKSNRSSHVITPQIDTTRRVINTWHINLHVSSSGTKGKTAPIIAFVGRCIATKLFIGKLPGTRGGWVIIG